MQETKLDKAQQETKELSLRNMSLTQEIVQIESRIQDLCEDLTKNETAHVVMRNHQIGAVLPLLGKKRTLLCKENKKKSMIAVVMMALSVEVLIGILVKYTSVAQ